MFGMTALPYVGELAKQADKEFPYLSAGLNVSPFLPPEYAKASMHIDESLATVSAGLKATPFVANNKQRGSEYIYI